MEGGEGLRRHHRTTATPAHGPHLSAATALFSPSPQASSPNPHLSAATALFSPSPQASSPTPYLSAATASSSLRFWMSWYCTPSSKSSACGMKGWEGVHSVKV